MAISSSGEITANEVYEEYHGDGQSPTGNYSLEQLQADWGLPETPDNTDIFGGKGRPEVSTFTANNVTSTSAEITGSISNAGGFSGAGDCDWRILFDQSDPPTTVALSGTVSHDFTGVVGDTITGLSPSTTYHYIIQARNNFDNGDWQEDIVIGVTTSPS